MNKHLHDKKNLSSRLAGYALTGSALMAMGSMANAQVIHSGPKNLPVTDPLTPVSIDIDGDLVDDFTLGLAQLSTLWNSYASTNSAWVINNGSSVYQGSWITKSAGEIVHALSSGDIIAASTSWGNDGTAYWNIGYYGPMFTGINCEFQGQGDMFMGVRFYIGANQHYGWVRLNVPADVTSMTIVDWAYQETPGAGLIAGDLVAPTATLTPDVYARTNVQTATVRVSFDEDVTGLELTDFVVTNGTADALSTVSASEFDLTVTAGVHGMVNVDLPAGVVADLSLNPTESAFSTSWFYDNRPPATTITAENEGINNLPTQTITIEFDEEVTGLEISDFLCMNCTPTDLTEITYRQVYELTVEMTAESMVTVDLPSGSVEDYGSNPNDAVGVSWKYDATNPYTTISRDFSSVTNEEVVIVTVIFDEKVDGLAEEDLSISGANITSITETVADTEFEVEITHSTEGEVSLEVLEDAIFDQAGNPASGTTVSWTYDASAPVMTIEPEFDSTNAALVTVNISADEYVEGMELTDLVVTNGTASNLVKLSKGLPPMGGQYYTVDITPASEGEVIIELPAASVTDPAGNENTLASASFIYDLTGPEASLSASGEISNETTETVTIQFDEAIEGLTAEDFIVTNGTAGELTAISSSEYQLSVSPTDQGVVTVDLPVSTVTDIAGNENTAAATHSWTFDSVAPEVTMETGLNEPTENETISITVIFNEPIEDLTANDFVVTNGSADNLVEVTAGQSYTIDITATANGEVSIELPAGAVVDLAGNENAAASVSYTYDGVNALNTISDMELKLYPNPATETINLELDRSANVRLTSLNGEVIMMREDVVSERFDISALPAGIYLLQIETAEGMLVKQIVKE